jgi:hypothetical protein
MGRMNRRCATCVKRRLRPGVLLATGYDHEGLGDAVGGDLEVALGGVLHGNDVDHVRHVGTTPAIRLRLTGSTCR